MVSRTICWIIYMLIGSVDGCVRLSAKECVPLTWIMCVSNWRFVFSHFNLLLSSSVTLFPHSLQPKTVEDFFEIKISMCVCCFNVVFALRSISFYKIKF
jgi:hypothetical protein